MWRWARLALLPLLCLTTPTPTVCWRGIVASSFAMIPGYKHVDSFGPDEDYETDEEIEYVTLDLGTIEPTLVPSSSTYRLIVSTLLICA